jgi:hypothetical protein
VLLGAQDVLQVGQQDLGQVHGLGRVPALPGSRPQFAAVIRGTGKSWGPGAAGGGQFAVGVLQGLTEFAEGAVDGGESGMCPGWLPGVPAATQGTKGRQRVGVRDRSVPWLSMT